MQKIRDLPADVYGNSIDADQMKAERRTAKFERMIDVNGILDDIQ